jgi:phospholipid/cholesterol/gamma-HCH transport system substrate-binding protein
MEIRAPYALIGLFVLAVIGAAFGFVYWLNNAGGLGKHEVYDIRFQNTVSGLLTGAAVLFDGIRVGEVTSLHIDADNPRQVMATIAVGAGTPVRADTAVGLDFQGLTGVPIVTLEGGSQKFAPGTRPVLVAPPDVGKSLTQAAREALAHLDKILVDNAEPLKNTIANINTFASALARNSNRVDGILKGIEKMTGGGPENAPPVMYDLTAPTSFPPIDKTLQDSIVVQEITTVLLYDTQKILVRPSGSEGPTFEHARWADTLPKLLQERIVNAFENAKFLGKVTKPIEGVTPKYQLLIDLRHFQVTVADGKDVADIEFSAKLMEGEGKMVAAKIFHATLPTNVKDAATAAAALNQTFQKAVTDLVVWTVASV